MGAAVAQRRAVSLGFGGAVNAALRLRSRVLRRAKTPPAVGPPSKRCARAPARELARRRGRGKSRTTCWKRLWRSFHPVPAEADLSSPAAFRPRRARCADPDLRAATAKHCDSLSRKETLMASRQQRSDSAPSSCGTSRPRRAPSGRARARARPGRPRRARAAAPGAAFGARSGDRTTQNAKIASILLLAGASAHPPSADRVGESARARPTLPAIGDGARARANQFTAASRGT